MTEGSTPPDAADAAPKEACVGGAAEQTETEATGDALSACRFMVADDAAESIDAAGSVCAALTSDGEEEEETCEAG